MKLLNTKQITEPLFPLRPVAHMEDRSRQRFGWGYLRERHHMERPRRRWEDNIKMYPAKLGVGTLN